MTHVNILVQFLDDTMMSQLLPFFYFLQPSTLSQNPLNKRSDNIICSMICNTSDGSGFGTRHRRARLCRFNSQLLGASLSALLLHCTATGQRLRWRRRAVDGWAVGRADGCGGGRLSGRAEDARRFILADRGVWTSRDPPTDRASPAGENSECSRDAGRGRSALGLVPQSVRTVSSVSVVSVVSVVFIPSMKIPSSDPQSSV